MLGAKHFFLQFEYRTIFSLGLRMPVLMIKHFSQTITRFESLRMFGAKHLFSEVEHFAILGLSLKVLF